MLSTCLLLVAFLTGSDGLQEPPAVPSVEGFSVVQFRDLDVKINDMLSVFVAQTIVYRSATDSDELVVLIQKHPAVVSRRVPEETNDAFDMIDLALFQRKEEEKVLASMRTDGQPVVVVKLKTKIDPATNQRILAVAPESWMLTTAGVWIYSNTELPVRRLLSEPSLVKGHKSIICGYIFTMAGESFILRADPLNVLQLQIKPPKPVKKPKEKK